MATTIINHKHDVGPVVRRMKEFPKHVQKAFTSAMHQAVLLLETESARGTPVGVGDSPTGHLRVSITSEVRGTSANIRGVVGSPANYGLAVELGSKAHWPPRGVLVRWAQLKLGLSAKQAERIEFVLRRAISRRGTPAVQMFDKAFQRSVPRIDRLMRQALERVARRSIG
jgi:hypothetical protein